MPAPTVAAGKRPQAPRPGGNAPAAPAIPFPIAARRKVSLGFTSASVNVAASANANVGPIEIPPTGFLRYLDLYVVGTAAGNSANVAYNADAPFNAIAYLTLTNAAGDTIIVPVDGYALYLFNKYGCLDQDAPCDPRSQKGYSATTGTGATGGSFAFKLRVPLEIDPETAFGAVPSMASNKSLQLGLQVASSATIYSTAPTAAPSVQVTGYQAFWAQPKSDNGRGTPQATVPDGNNSIMMWRLDTPSVTPGDKTIKINNVGNVLRMIIFDYRTSAGARSESDVPGTHYIRLNNDEMYYLSDGKWKDDMASAYDYTATNETAKGLDNGIRVFHYWLASDGKAKASSPRSQYLPTLDTTLLQYRGVSFGSGISTLKIYTCEIKPTSSAALYQHT